jgi:hypothetical protein
MLPVASSCDKDPNHHKHRAYSHETEDIGKGMHHIEVAFGTFEDIGNDPTQHHAPSQTEENVGSNRHGFSISDHQPGHFQRPSLDLGKVVFLDEKWNATQTL